MAYKFVVNAHNLKAIETDPIPFSDYTDESILRPMAKIIHDVEVFADKVGLKNFSLTISISEVK